MNGFPNFTGVMHESMLSGIGKKQASVFAYYVGSRHGDYQVSNAALTLRFPIYANFQPRGTTWHHHEIVGIMMLTKTGASVTPLLTVVGHGLLGHTGGVFYYSIIYNIKKYG